MSAKIRYEGRPRDEDPGESIRRLETLAIAEALVATGKPLTPDTRAAVLAVTHMFAATVIDLENRYLDLHRRLAG